MATKRLNLLMMTVVNSSAMDFIYHNSLQEDNIIIFRLLFPSDGFPSTFTFGTIINYYRDKHVRSPFFMEKWLDLFIDQEFYRNFRMYRDTFNVLLNLVGHEFSKPKFKESFPGRSAIPLNKQLLTMLWYLAKGDTHINMSHRFDIALSTVNKVTSDMIECICRLASIFIKWPAKNECQEIVTEFQALDGYPGVIGAIDGCHIRVKVPEEQQDSYLNRKFHHSIVLQGICTSRKLYTNVFVGCPGSAHDARVLRESQVYKITQSNGIQKLFYGNEYHLIGDSAYPCLSWLMKPYRDTGRLTAAQRRHNRGLSRTRVPIENTFGLCKGRWRILNFIDVYSIAKSVNIIKACCALHNFCLLQLDDTENFSSTTEEEVEPESPTTWDVDQESGTIKRDDICAGML